MLQKGGESDSKGQRLRLCKAIKYWLRLCFASEMVRSFSPTFRLFILTIIPRPPTYQIDLGTWCSMRSLLTHCGDCGIAMCGVVHITCANHQQNLVCRGELQTSSSLAYCKRFVCIGINWAKNRASKEESGSLDRRKEILREHQPEVLQGDSHHLCRRKYPLFGVVPFLSCP